MIVLFELSRGLGVFKAIKAVKSTKSGAGVLIDGWLTGASTAPLLIFTYRLVKPLFRSMGHTPDALKLFWCREIHNTSFQALARAQKKVVLFIISEAFRSTGPGTKAGTYAWG